jgi:hypothetical protein
VGSTTLRLLGALTQLEVLKIGPSSRSAKQLNSKERLDGSVFKDFLCRMTNLQSLTLFKIESDIKIDWFSKLKRLHSLKLKACHLHTDLSAISSLTTLTELEISGVPFYFETKEKGLLKFFKRVTTNKQISLLFDDIFFIALLLFSFVYILSIYLSIYIKEQ